MPTVFRSNSALKLVELSFHFPIFHHARTVLDLAAAPGGFSQVALEQMSLMCYQPTSVREGGGRSDRERRSSSSPLEPLVIAVDQRDIWPLHGLHTIHQLNIQHTGLLHRCVANSLDLASPPGISSSLPSRRRVVDVVLHDGVSVHSGQDDFSVFYAQNQMVLQILRFSCELFTRQSDLNVLPVGDNYRHSQKGRAPEGRHNFAVQAPSACRLPVLPVFFVSKVFRSSQLDLVMEAFRTFFQHVQQYRPSATPASSLETYVIANGFRSHRWREYEEAKRKGPEVFRLWSRHKKWKGRRDVFSLPPSVHDLPRGKQFIWKCVGCQELRFGVSNCPLCS